MTSTIITASELIQRRTSWRSCTGEAIPSDSLSELTSVVEEKAQSAKLFSLRLEIIAAQENDSEELKGLGTYGFIRGASAFLLGTVNKSSNQLEAYGRLMEDIVLQATRLDLATTWLGGSFQKSNFSARINTTEEEVVPAVISVGVPARNRNRVDRLIRQVAGSRKRLPWESLFFGSDGTTPLSREAAGRLAPVLDMVRLSPSASNKQPWRLVVENQKIHFYLKRTRGYRKPLFSDLQRIDIGISMSHFQAVCEELGIGGGWQLFSTLHGHPEHGEYITTWVL